MMEVENRVQNQEPEPEGSAPYLFIEQWVRKFGLEGPAALCLSSLLPLCDTAENIRLAFTFSKDNWNAAPVITPDRVRDLINRLEEAS